MWLGRQSSASDVINYTSTSLRPVSPPWRRTSPSPAFSFHPPYLSPSVISASDERRSWASPLLLPQLSAWSRPRAVWRSQTALFALKFLCASTGSRREADTQMRALPLASQNALSLRERPSRSHSRRSVAAHLRDLFNRHCLGETELTMSSGCVAPLLDPNQIKKRRKAKIAYWDDRMMSLGSFCNAFLTIKPQARVRSCTHYPWS